MRKTTDLFKINGKPMLAPDAGMEFSFEDLDSDDSGRDEGGYMHRIVARYKVGKWPFSYSHLTEEERVYMEGLFPDAPEFDFTRPDRITGNPVTTPCYRSKCSISWWNSSTGQWRNYGFNIIEC